MGGFAPVIGALGSLSGSIGTVATTVGTVIGTAKTLQSLGAETSQEKAIRQMQERQALQERQMRDTNNLKREENALSATEEERRRKRALKAAVARQRAGFGASGISVTGGGSAEAVLLGLYNEDAQLTAQNNALSGLRDRSLDLSETQVVQRNLLSRTQVQENQKTVSILEE